MLVFGTFPPPLLFTILSVRLRIEEERLLEMKRIEELERIRGPSEAWYDLHLLSFLYVYHHMKRSINFIRV